MAEDHLIARVGVTAIINMQPDMKVVAEAVNGQQALQLFRKHLPDVVLLDIRMPVMSGPGGGRGDSGRVTRTRA